MLGVLLTDDDVVGESFYNPLLPVVVDELDAMGLLVEDDGALCVFPPGFENRNGEPLPLIVRKSDGGYGYPATDLAAVRDRTGRLGATRLALRRRGRAVAAPPPGLRRGRPRRVPASRRRAEHVGFGLVLGTDGKKLASRSGGTERLIDLLERRRSTGPPRPWRSAPATSRPNARRPSRTPWASARSSTPTSPPNACRDYVFDWDRMLAFEGDTGPYLQYAHARIRSIFRRAGVAPPAPGAAPVLGEPQERALALQLLGFGAAVETTAEACSPSKLCTYLFELATTFTSFYEACRVLVDDETLRASRLGAVRSHRPGPGPRPLAARDRGPRADVTGAGPAPILCPAPQVRARRGGPTRQNPQGVAGTWI